MISINKRVLTKVLLAVGVLIVLLIAAFLTINPPQTKSKTIGTPQEANGKQIISIVAKAGFSPSDFVANSNKETILRVSTKNTFDCSSTVYIPSLGINRTLPFSGDTDIDIPPQVAGTKLEGTCSMGMYSFTINFT